MDCVWGDTREYPPFTAECTFLNDMMHFMHLVIEEPIIAAMDSEGDVCREIALPEGMEEAGLVIAQLDTLRGNCMLGIWFLIMTNSLCGYLRIMLVKCGP